jgi:hypothetical protein
MAIKPKKSIEKSEKKIEKQEKFPVKYDIFSKSRGYMCSCLSQQHAINTLEALLRENDKFWRQARSMGKKTKDFDCYCMCRQGLKSWELPFVFDTGEDEEEEFNPEEGME